MQPKSIVVLLLVNLVLLVVMPANAYENVWWDNNWSYRQEVTIPIDTSTEVAKYQPIDVYVEFDNPCWAKNEHEHSIRVLFQDGENLNILESQIYEIEYADDTHIKACNLVFLIPEEANGRERYYVYYDGNEKPSPNLVDHVSVEESYYLYEPVAGYPFESRYYKIIEDGYIVYAVSQEGEFMGYTTSQHVTKLKEKTTEAMPKNGELFASFNFRYYYDHGMMDYSTTSRRLVSKEILVDGNLMVEFGIVSESERDDIQTTAIYKYYYCPTENKRIHTHVKHEILEELIADQESNTDGIFAGLQCGGVTSASIQDLNFGKMFPYLHLYNEMEMIGEHPIDPDPEYIPDDYDIRVLNNKDDVDLGTQAWASFDEGPSGISHSIIFGSNNVVKYGQDERDGIQINSYEMDYPHLPGIETNRAVLEFGRNSYEKRGVHDLVIPAGFVVEFDAEFFSSKTGGFQVIQDEADIFQSLVKIKPSWGEKLPERTKEKEEHKLTVFVHFAFSFPLGAPLSALTGKEFSFITAEIYKDEETLSSGTPRRLTFNSLSRDITIRRRIMDISFDWRNISLFKKITFQNIPPGRYLVKVYKENPLFGKERKYIGFRIVDVKADAKTHVFCGAEGSMRILVVDLNDEAVKDAEARLLKDDVVIAKSVTDGTGQTLLKAPIANSYDLKVLYNGFIISEERVRLLLLRKLVPIKKTVEIERHDFMLKVVDLWELPLAIELNPFVISKGMDEPTVISANRLAASVYLFTNLIPSSYQLSLRYKSFSKEKDIQVPTDKDIRLVFPAEFNITVNTLDARGVALPDAKILVSRDGKKLEVISEPSGLVLPLPPGVYSVSVYHLGELVGSRKINVLGERSFDMITTHEPLFPYLVTMVVIIFGAVALVFSYVKKDVMYFLKTLSVSLAITAIVFPWWILHGLSSQVETATKMFLIPLELITVTTSPSIIGGELAYLPEIFVDIVSLIPLFTVTGCLIILGSIVIKKFNKKLYYLSLLLALLAFVVSLLIFSVAMSQLTEVGVGRFLGEGNLDIKIPGEETVSTIFCSWGPTTGFLLYVVSTLTLFFTFVYTIRKRKKDSKK
ncbi:MAG: carboxypeptidase regulatory-like domain-containing protein [Thermoplasmatales archaeon]|nr:MAG: carboxypeptidase regulatory-like domain-containing protein [Thermoplasmatales archaeon]